MKWTIVAAALAVLPLQAVAATVDLSGWVENGFKGSSGAGTWTVGAGNDSVFQSRNGDPTVFFDPGSNAQGTSLAGTIKVETTSDDDFVGFVLGYQDGELNSDAADFWLIDWKQNNQSGGALRGLALSHVSGDIKNGSAASPMFWAHATPVSEKQRATNLGNTGWADNTEYKFELTFTSTLIEVFVDGALELSYSSADHGTSFTDGAFGFYNYSQSNVRYAGITEDVLPPSPSAVPLPASLPLLLAGMGILGVARRRNRS